MKLLKYACICLFLLSSYRGQAQVDAHFSQYYAYPIWLNPALTGIHDGDYRVSLNYKNQWNTVSKPYTTTGASFDYSPAKQFGLGITLLNQAAGDAGYNNLTALVSTSYRIRFGEEGYQNLSFGIQAGLNNSKFDPSKLQFGNQYAPNAGFDPAMPSSERFSATSGSALNLNAGIMFFDSNPLSNVNTFAGIAVANINRPQNPLVVNKHSTIPIRYTAHGGVRIRASEYLDISPNMIFISQGTASELVGGISGTYKLEGNNDLLFGASLRRHDATITYLGLRLKDYVLGMSYDINTSNLVKASQNRGGLEVSLSFTPHTKPSKVDFICPRL